MVFGIKSNSLNYTLRAPTGEGMNTASRNEGIKCIIKLSRLTVRKGIIYSKSVFAHWPALLQRATSGKAVNAPICFEALMAA